MIKVKQKFKSNSGVTLVELLLYMGLSLILLAIISGLFISMLQTRNEAMKTSSLEREGRYILARLSYDIYSAQDIIEPALLGATSTTLQLMKDSELFTYRIIDDRLYLINDTGSHLLSGETVKATDFSVIRLGNDGGKNAVAISLTTQSQNISEGKIETRTYQTTLAIR